jgi:hypothetical protein
MVLFTKSILGQMNLNFYRKALPMLAFSFEAEIFTSIFNVCFWISAFTLNAQDFSFSS